MGIGGIVGTGAVMNTVMDPVVDIDTVVTVLDQGMKSVEDTVTAHGTEAPDLTDVTGAETFATQSPSPLTTMTLSIR